VLLERKTYDCFEGYIVSIVKCIISQC